MFQAAAVSITLVCPLLYLYIYISLSLYLYLYIYLSLYFYRSISLYKSLYLYIYYISPSISLYSEYEKIEISLFISQYLMSTISNFQYVIFVSFSISISHLCLCPYSLSLSLYLYISPYLSVSLCSYIFVSCPAWLEIPCYLGIRILWKMVEIFINLSLSLSIYLSLSLCISLFLYICSMSSLAWDTMLSRNQNPPREVRAWLR